MLRLPRPRRRAVLLVTLASAALACGGDGPTAPQVGDIVLQPADLRLRQKESHRVTATVTDASGTLLAGVPVTFASTNEGIVTVSSIGEVTSVGPAGSALVRVTAGRFTKSLPVTVNGIATSLRLTPSPATVAQGATLALQASVLDLVETPIPGQAFTFTSLTPQLLTVNPAGVVTPVGPHGTGRIRARSGELFADVDVTVTQAPTALGVSPASLLLPRGERTRLHVWIADAIGVPIPGTPSVAFATSDAAIAPVDADGTVRAGSALGEATITVTSGTFTATVPVRVAELVHPRGEIAARVSLPGAFGVAFTRGGAAYAVSISHGVHRLDLQAATATPVAAIPGLDLAITSDGARAYVARQDAGTVELVELSTGRTLQSSQYLGNSALTDLLWSDERTLWVGTGSGVVALDAASLASLGSFPAGAAVHLAAHPTLPYVYASSNAGTVAEIDVSSRTVRRTLTVGARTQGLVVSRDGAELYVADESGPLRVVTLATGAVSSIDTPDGGYGLAMSPDGSRLYVSRSMYGDVMIVDLAARARVGTLALSGVPRRLAMNASGTTLLVALEGGEVVVVR